MQNQTEVVAMSIAVTGARGNIGSKVVELISNNKDIEVVAVVRRPIGIENLPLNVRPIVADYGKPGDLQEALFRCQCGC